MIFVNDKKYACETCIKGHRSSSCQHTERALFEIKKKGRPVTQCDHCRELRKTKQVHVRCSCDTKPDTTIATPKAPGVKKGSRLPAEAAYPHGLTPGVAGVATSPAPAKQQHAVACTCGKGETCHCCVPRKAVKPSGHTPPPVYASGHTPNNPHPPHQHHQHAYAPYARPARLSTDTHSLHLANPNSASNLGLPTNIVPTPGAMYRVGPCACGTTCACPDCALHRQQPHSHQVQQNPQPVRGHGGEPCPIRCANCFDCAGGLTLLLDPNAAAYRVPPYDADALSAFSGSDPNGSVQSFESEVQTGAYTTSNGNGQYSTGAAASSAQPGFFSPGLVDASGMDVEMDNAEFNAAMAGLDAGIDHANNFSADPASTWDRPRCGFAVSGERGNGSPGHHQRVGSEVGSEIGVGSDGGYDLASEYGIGSDDGGSVVGASATNLSLDFADLNFGLGVPQQQYTYSDHVSQRFSGEYSHSMHGGRVASTSSQFSNHSNLSLVSSIESASVSLASLGSSHGIASLASSHGIPPSGRVTPGHSGRITPVRGVAPHSPQNGKPLPRGYRRILPKVAAMTNHRPFRRFHSQQPSLHAVMESDAAGGNVTSPPPSQVLLQPQMSQQQQQQQQVQQPRVRKSIRSHLPIVGKHFAPGGRYEPSRLRNYHQQQALVQQALAQQQQQQRQQQPQQSQAQHALQGQPSSPSPLQYPPFSQAQVQTPSGFSPALGYGDHSPGQGPPEVYVETEDGVIYEEEEPPEMDAYEYGHGYEFGDPSFADGDQTHTAGASPSGSLFVQQPLQQQQQQQVSVSLPVHAQMVAALAHGPVSLSYERPDQAQESFIPLQPQQQLQQPARPQLPQAQHSSSQSTTMPAPSPIIVIDSAMQSPQMLPDTDSTPPSPRQKISSGVGMPLTMSLPLTNVGMDRGRRTYAYDDADADVKVPMNKDMSSPGGGPGGQGRKSRWPSFSVHGHRVTVGAKVMGAAYATRS